MRFFMTKSVQRHTTSGCVVDRIIIFSGQKYHQHKANKKVARIIIGIGDNFLQQGDFFQSGTKPASIFVNGWPLSALQFRVGALPFSIQRLSALSVSLIDLS